MKRLRALVSGAAGFIGSHLCDRLVAEGYQVVGIDNFLTGDRSNVLHLAENASFVLVEHDVSLPLEIDGPFDVIFHLASPASPKAYAEHSVETMLAGSHGTFNLLEMARRWGAKFVLASTSEVYGDPLVHPQDESYWGNVNPVGPRACYDEAKRFAEALTMTFHRKYGLRTAIARIFNTYGPRMQLDDGRVVPTFIDRALRGEPITVYGDGSQTRSFCYVSDLVEGLMRLASCDDPHPVNLGNPEEWTILEFAKYIQELTGSRSPIVFEPLPPDDPKRRRPDISRARKLLGWEPKVPLEQGLKMTIEYFQTKLQTVSENPQR